MNTELEKYSNIKKRLHSYRQKVKMRTLWYGLVIFFAIVVVSGILVVASETLGRFEPTGRTVLLIVWMVIAGTSFSWYIIRPLFDLVVRKKSPPDIQIALDVGRSYPDVRDRMANALQLQNFDHVRPENYSSELIKAALLSIVDSVKNKDFGSIVDFTIVKKAGRTFASGLVVAIGLWMGFSTPFSSSTNRLVHPNTYFSTGPEISIIVTPGNVEILKGENVTIQATVSGKSIKSVMLEWRRLSGGDPETKILVSELPDTFRYTIKSIKDSLYYRVIAEKVSSPRYAISVIELPMIRNLQLKLTMPSYSRLGTQLLDENIGDLTALKGSVAQVSAKTNKIVASADLVFSDESRIPLAINGNQCTGQFRVMKDLTYYFHLKDNSGNDNPDPLVYRIVTLPDRDPVVSIPVPGLDVDIGEAMILPIQIMAEDDFGFSRLQLGIKVLRGSIIENDTSGVFQFTDLEIEKPGESKLQKQFRWDLNNLELLPEDVVVYFARVFDNDNVSGPKSAKSNLYRIRFPSIYEIYQEVAQTHEETFESLEGIRNRTQELQERFENIVQAMQKDPSLNWEERKELEDAIDIQKLMQQELQELNQQLENMIEQMEHNDLVTEQTMEKYQELQDLFKEIATPELKDAMRQLSEAIQKMDPEELRKAAENFKFTQEDLLKSLDRTIALLKQLQIEQMLDEAIRKADDLSRRQDEVNKLTEASEKPGDQIAQKEQGVMKDTKELQKLLNNLQEKLTEVPELPSEGIQKAESFMDSTQLPGQMNQMSQQMMAGDKKKAQQTGNQISSNLQQLSQMLQDAKTQMGMGMQQQIMQTMRKTTLDLLELSKRQEQLMEGTQELDRNSPQVGGMAEQQQDLTSGLGRVMDEIDNLSQKSMVLTPQMGAALGKSAGNMNHALDALENRNPSNAARSQELAMSELNQAVKQMQNFMQQMCQMSGSGGMGMQQLIQQLQQMAQQQQGINQQTLGLGMGGQLSLAQQAAMQRLAAQQRSLSERLEALHQQMEGKSQIPGSLEKIAEDMEEVAGDLQQKKINRHTIDRQQRILSRLLDAQRSIRRRDYSKKREAETGKQYYAISPGALPENLGEGKNSLQEDLLRAQKEGYSRDYLELIRQYFEALQKEQTEDEN